MGVFVRFRILLTQMLNLLCLAGGVILPAQRSVGLSQSVSSQQVIGTQANRFAQMLDGSVIVLLFIGDTTGEGLDRRICRRRRLRWAGRAGGVVKVIWSRAERRLRQIKIHLRPGCAQRERDLELGLGLLRALLSFEQNTVWRVGVSPFGPVILNLLEGTLGIAHPLRERK